MRKWLDQSRAPEYFDNFMSFMIAVIDAVLASQNAALAALSGLRINEELCKKIREVDAANLAQFKST